MTPTAVESLEAAPSGDQIAQRLEDTNPPNCTQEGSKGTQKIAITHTNEQSVFMMQQRLILLNHASKCELGSQCPASKHCGYMKILWSHMLICKDNDCQMQHCVSSRYILSHYGNCKDINCHICTNVRKSVKRERPEDRKHKVPGAINPKKSRQLYYWANGICWRCKSSIASSPCNCEASIKDISNGILGLSIGCSSDSTRSVKGSVGSASTASGDIPRSSPYCSPYLTPNATPFHSRDTSPKSGTRSESYSNFVDCIESQSNSERVRAKAGAAPHTVFAFKDSKGVAMSPHNQSQSQSLQRKDSKGGD